MEKGVIEPGWQSTEKESKHVHFYSIIIVLAIVVEVDFRRRPAGSSIRKQ